MTYYCHSEAIFHDTLPAYEAFSGHIVGIKQTGSEMEDNMDSYKPKGKERGCKMARKNRFGTVSCVKLVWLIRRRKEIQEMSYAGIINSEGNSCLHHPGGEIWTIRFLKREPGQRTNIERIRTARRRKDVYILHLFHQCRRACRPACKIFKTSSTDGSPPSHALWETVAAGRHEG